jgi:ParB family chromosome partitioning protein
MKLEFIPLGKLFVDRANMRHGKRAPDVSDILPSVRARGVIQPVIVRAAADGAFGIVAGSRRFHAALAVAAERPDAEPEPMPCAVLDQGDDAGAVEASLIENLARLDPDEVTQWETFTRLVREGRKPAEIAAVFGLPDMTVRRVLALGNLLPRIRDLYRHEAIDAATVRHLTMATKAQQRQWLVLADDAEAHAPTGHQLKAWLFGGQSIPAAHALFDVEGSGLATVADLFGEERYFADADAFWTAQNAAIDARRGSYLEAGWADVVVLPPQQLLHSWEHEHTPKKKGGRVYVDVRGNGEVVFHEGYLGRAEARRRERGEGDGGAAKPARPELTSTLETYVDLHRHAAVRAALVDHPGAALRLMAAHAITGSHLWRIAPEPQLARNEAVAESVETCAAETRFDERRRAVLALLGFSPEEPCVTGGNADPGGLAALFVRLLGMPDDEVMTVVAVVMGETLAAGSPAVEAVGRHLSVDMAAWWRVDDALLEGLRDREVLLAILAEVAGEPAASGNAKEKTKTLRGIVRDRLEGTNGRERLDGWVPRWMRFPPSAYTARGGVGTVRRALQLDALAPDPDPDPAAPAGGAASPAPQGEAASVAVPLAA